jgi:hypothetical protein
MGQSWCDRSNRKNGVGGVQGLEFNSMPLSQAVERRLSLDALYSGIGQQ